MKIETWELTGFSGGYEATTQHMLWNAVRFFAENPDKTFPSMQNDSIVGIAFNEGENGKAFDKAMMEGVDDATGAMHQCATNHALFIKKNGYKKWYAELKEARETDEQFSFLYEPDFALPKEEIK